jgi:hypothetical protein
MVNRLVLAVAFAAAAVASLVACDVLVDLGPKATLRDAGSGPSIEAGVDVGADAADSGAPDDAEMPDSMLSCGLAPAANKMCDDCSNQYCCDLSLQCGKSAWCAQGMQELQNCVYQPVCVGNVDSKYADAGVVELQNCVVNYCTAACFPGTNCNMLAGCCGDIPDAQVVARQVCIGAVNQLNETNCVKVLDNTLRSALGSQFCGGPAPDAGGD